jgi:hypothetical protein
MNKEVDLPYRAHFWVSSYPFFETTLILIPPVQSSSPQCSATLTAYDSDGATINTVQMSFPANETQLVEVEPLMGSCKLECGVKHGHIVVELPYGGGAACRIHTRESATMVSEPRIITPSAASFVPLTLGAGRMNFLLCVNRSQKECIVKARLFFGKRSPETSWTLPPFGTRIVLVESEFAPYLGLEKSDQIQAYIRMSTKSGEIGVQTLERTEGAKDEAYFSSMS